MYDAFYDIIQSSLEDLQLHYMDTDTIHYMATDVLSFSEGKVDDMHMVISNIDITIKTNKSRR